MPRAVTSAFAGHQHDDEDQYHDHHGNDNHDNYHPHLRKQLKSKMLIFLQQWLRCPWQQACLPSMHEHW